MEDGDLLVGLNSDAILNGIADGVIVVGLERKVLFVNRAAQEILGGADGESIMCGENCREVVAHSACALGCLMSQTMKTGEHIYNYEAVLEKDGKKKTLSINTSAIRDKNGKVIGAAEIFRDVTLIQELKSELKDRYSFNNVVGRNYKMHEVYELLHEVAPTRSTVLIEGESGTGKELIANAIHHSSPRSGKPFIKLNCAALAEGVLESELFGHVKGAYTGAIADKAGRFELANGGTLFLDEIGEISLQTQVKLLRVLQESEFERVGGTKSIKVDVRVVAATNRELKDMVEKGAFREDLYYRLKVVPIRLPALRERTDDIPILVNHFIEKFNKEMSREITNLSPRTMELLMDYNYPGNIRELEHVMEHAFVRCRGKTIHPEHLPKELQSSDLIDRAMDSDEPLKELERETIVRALNESDWKLQTCAKRLKISRTTLWRRMKDLGIEKK
ncbi:MAG: sigma 54-interacting transcriptional regulator [Deltaproteobacteria bacterium]|nr:sigma 54-interacting transcriptional regulator [Deltaproteobacteria bacterium]